jgi:plasmid stabilization system protein ParE
MSYLVDWSDQAKFALDDVTLYHLDVAGLAVADKNRIVLLDSVATLANHPYRCKAGRVLGTFEHVISNLPYIIIFTVDNNNNIVLVLDILHTSRAYP